MEKYLTKRNILIVIVFVIIALIFIIYQVVNSNNNNLDVNIVTSNSKFYTVSNCVNRYITYLYDKDVDNLIVLLDNDYIKKNKISKDNFFDKIGPLDNRYSFVANKMYQEVLNDNITKYYVRGYLFVDDMSYSYNKRIDYYLIVILDTKNSTYSIVPYDGEIFNKEENNEK